MSKNLNNNKQNFSRKIQEIHQITQKHSEILIKAGALSQGCLRSKQSQIQPYKQPEYTLKTRKEEKGRG